MADLNQFAETLARFCQMTEHVNSSLDDSLRIVVFTQHGADVEFCTNPGEGWTPITAGYGKVEGLAIPEEWVGKEVVVIL